ncbi:hypothetical protein LMG9673_01432 [Ralstonia pseudosolanacearum]|nr:hypothetical protein LMG9673_01432 [Ralstonia pseudosolanacearum]
MEITRSFDSSTPLGGGGPVLLQRAAKRCLAPDPCYPGQLSDRHQSDLLSRHPGTGRMGRPHHDLLQPARCAMVHRPFQQVLDRKRLVIGQIGNDRCDPRSARSRVRSLSEQHQRSVAVCVVPTLHLHRAVGYLARPSQCASLRVGCCLCAQRRPFIGHDTRVSGQGSPLPIAPPCPPGTHTCGRYRNPGDRHHSAPAYGPIVFSDHAADDRTVASADSCVTAFHGRPDRVSCCSAQIAAEPLRCGPGVYRAVVNCSICTGGKLSRSKR